MVLPCMRGIDFMSFWLDDLSHLYTTCYSNRSIECAAKNRCGKGKVHLSYAKLSPHLQNMLICTQFNDPILTYRTVPDIEWKQNDSMD